MYSCLDCLGQEVLSHGVSGPQTRSPASLRFHLPRGAPVSGLHAIIRASVLSDLFMVIKWQDRDLNPGLSLEKLCYTVEEIPCSLWNIFYVPEVFVFFVQIYLFLLILSYFPRPNRFKYSKVALFLQFDMFVFRVGLCNAVSKCRETLNSSSTKHYTNENILRMETLVFSSLL